MSDKKVIVINIDKLINIEGTEGHLKETLGRIKETLSDIVDNANEELVKSGRKTRFKKKMDEKRKEQKSKV